MMVRSRTATVPSPNDPGGAGDAQDAVQECFLSAYVHLKKFGERARFSTWLTRIAINAALMKIRKNRVSREVGAEDAADAVELSDSVPNPEEICARTEQKAALRDAIAVDFSEAARSCSARRFRRGTSP